ncbi:hypothetical protein [Sorangium sp. So ce861]|uniref:hypothetical protein n=1 Tax=Sorangium sp. So ce861 TaxID=3133323 RepID=UPI003F63768F
MPLAVGEALVESAAIQRELEDYKRANRLPPTVQRLTADMTDVLDDNRYHATPVPILWKEALEGAAEDLPERAFFAVLTADRFRFLHDEPVTLRLQVYQGRQSKREVSFDVISIKVVVMERSPDEERRALERVVYEGAPAWVAGPDGMLTALDPAAMGLGGFHGYLKVQVRWRLSRSEPASVDLGERVSDAIVHYTDEPWARFTGRVDDALVDGSLRVRVGVEVKRAAKYHVSVLLFDAAGKIPLAYAYFADELTTADRHVDVDFYGLLFHDAKAAGPFTVQRVDGYVIDGSSLDRGPQLASAYPQERTSVYDLDDLRSDEWTSPMKDRWIAAAELEIRRRAVNGSAAGP